MRILERLDELYAIGGGPGANRPHPSAAEDEAHRLVASWCEEADLSVEVDAHGTLFGHAPRSGGVWVGSHVDRSHAAEGSTVRSASSRQWTSSSRAGAGSVVVFRGEEVGCVGSRATVAAGGPLPRVFLELHIEQGPVLAERGEAAGSRDRDRRLRARRTRPRRTSRPRGDDADGRARRRARRGGG